MSENKSPLILVIADFGGVRHLDFQYMEHKFKTLVFGMSEADVEEPKHELIRLGMSQANDISRIDVSAYSEIHVLVVAQGILLEPLLKAAKYLVNVYTHDTLPSHYDFEKVVYEN